MKACSRCKELKSLSSFYGNKNTRDGKAPHCKSCHQAQVNVYRKLYADNHKRQAKVYRMEHRAEHIGHQRVYHENNPVKRRQRVTMWRRNNRKKHLAQSAVYTAVKVGRLIKPINCESCGERKLLHGHHDDYAQRLNVKWLCVLCHRSVHTQEVVNG